MATTAETESVLRRETAALDIEVQPTHAVDLPKKTGLLPGLAGVPHLKFVGIDGAGIEAARLGDGEPWLEDGDVRRGARSGGRQDLKGAAAQRGDTKVPHIAGEIAVHIAGDGKV